MATSNNSDNKQTASESESEDFPQLMIYVNYFVGLVALLIVLTDLFAITIMKKCNRMPFQTQLLSINLIFSDCVGSLAFLVNQCIMFVFRINSDKTNNIRIVTVGTMLSISWCSVAVLTFDRAVALKASLRYSSMIRRRTIRVVIFFIWTFHLTVAPLLLLHGFKEKCSFQFDDNCNVWEATKLLRFFEMILLVLVVFSVVGLNAYVYKIARRHEIQIAEMRNASFKSKRVTPENTISERQFSATKAVVRIVLAFILLHAPIIIHLFILESNVELRGELPRRMFHAISYICIQISSFVNLSLYVGKFKEFRMHLYLFVGNFFDAFSRKAEDLRVDVYNIIVSTDSVKRRQK